MQNERLLLAVILQNISNSLWCFHGIRVLFWIHMFLYIYPYIPMSHQDPREESCHQPSYPEDEGWVCWSASRSGVHAENPTIPNERNQNFQMHFSIYINHIRGPTHCWYLNGSVAERTNETEHGSPWQCGNSASPEHFHDVPSGFVTVDVIPRSSQWQTPRAVPVHWSECSSCHSHGRVFGPSNLGCKMPRLMPCIHAVFLSTYHLRYDCTIQLTFPDHV